ncbi:MAG TPA: hypothetical protein VF221_08095 [Chloroflexota bacterium]
MKYELRGWYEDGCCLYTDDPRVKDLAARSRDLTIVSTYFRSAGAHQPFAWDIVGAKEVLADISQRFTSLARPRSRRR